MDTFPPPIVRLALCPRCHGEGSLYPPCPSVAEMVAAPECPVCEGTGEAEREESDGGIECANGKNQ